MVEIIDIQKYQSSPAGLVKVKHLCRDFEYFDTYADFFKDPYYRVYCAWAGDLMLGLIVCSRHSYVLNGDFLWVDLNHRNRQVGTQLLHFIEELAREEGYRAICGDSISTNTRAHAFYLRYGAEKYGEYDNLYGEGTECIYMFRKKIRENL